MFTVDVDARSTKFTPQWRRECSPIIDHAFDYFFSLNPSGFTHCGLTGKEVFLWISGFLYPLYHPYGGLRWRRRCNLRVPAPKQERYAPAIQDFHVECEEEEPKLKFSVLDCRDREFRWRTQGPSCAETIHGKSVCLGLGERWLINSAYLRLVIGSISPVPVSIAAHDDIMPIMPNHWKWFSVMNVQWQEEPMKVH